jgi:hypothetical protein
MRARAFFCFASLALAACGSNANAPAPSRTEAAGVDPTARPPRVREERAGWARTPAPEPTPLELAPPPATAVVIEETVVTEAEAPPEPTTPRRDYGDDLREAIGDISGCLDAQTAAGLSGSLSVSVSATAMPSGRLQRVSVSAGSLPAAAQSCIRSRVESSMMPTPIEGAPRSVSTTLRFQVTAQVTTETRTRFATDGPQPGRTQAPGVVLPALGDPGPATGAQAPAHTLPALADPGPAPGHVPPGHTLPAQGAPERR